MTNKKPTQSVYIPPPLRSRHGINHASSTSPNPPNRSEISGNIISKENPPSVDDISSLVDNLSISAGDESRHNRCIISTSADVNSPTSKCTDISELDFSKYLHVIELSTTLPELNSADLQAELSGFEDSGFYLKWVDDNHCLAVFSSASEAHRALAHVSGLSFKAVRMEDASKESKLKLAKSPGDWAMPYKKRPPTMSSIARRLITGHLGLKPVRKTPLTIEREKREKQALNNARVKLENRKRAQKSTWGDD